MRSLIGLAVEKFGGIDVCSTVGSPAQTGGIEGLAVDRSDVAMASWCAA